jgi:hypothetical protein
MAFTMSALRGRTFHPALAAPLLLLMISGCLPARVVWLPDSSGVVFTGDEYAQVVKYDLNKDVRTVLVDDTNSKTPWPAISQDGRRLAVARVDATTRRGSTKQYRRIELTFYDLAGQEHGHSAAFKSTVALDTPASSTRSFQEEARLDWSGPPTKIVLNEVIYDCEHDAWTSYGGQVFPYLDRPVRPDGAGFLAVIDDGLAFVDWDGKARKFAGDGFDPETDMDLATYQGMTWDGQVARMKFEKVVLELDTDTMTHACRPVPKRLRKSLDGSRIVHQFPNGQAIRVVERSMSRRNLSGPTALEIGKPGDANGRIVIDQISFDVRDLAFFPSPDGHKVAFVGQGIDGDLVAIIADSGELLATLRWDETRPPVPSAIEPPRGPVEIILDALRWSLLGPNKSTRPEPQAQGMGR